MAGARPRAAIRHRIRRVRAVLLLVLMLHAIAVPAHEVVEVSAAREVQAAYLYKFANYVDWPAACFASADSPLVIGVLADDELADALEAAVRGKQAQGRRLELRRLGPGDPVHAVHLLFVGTGADEQQVRSLARPHPPVLTVSEHGSTHAAATMVHFLVSDQRVRFDVDLDLVRASGLRISALMLTAAHDVVREDG